MKSARAYQRLPGKRRTLGRWYTLWLGADHLLSVECTGYSEDYTRFYLGDIRGVISRRTGHGKAWSITLAVAGFAREDIEVTQEESQLWIRGRQQDDRERQFLHRGIAARQFQRAFLLAEGMQVLGADLADGLLSVDLVRPELERIVKNIEITVRS